MEIFGNNQYHNMVDDPYLNNNYQNRGFINSCGCLGADGSSDPTPGEVPVTEDAININQKVRNMQAFSYAKNILAIIGAFLVIKLVFTKFLSHD
jgi:hypothetical protein